MSETVEVGRKHPSFRFPVLKNPTGVVQFAIDKAEVVTIDKIGDVRRGQVIAVKNPNFARGLVASRNFAHCAADTPLGLPSDAPAIPMTEKQIEAMTEDRRKTEKAEMIEDLEALRAGGAFAALSDTEAANREHLSTFDGSPESVNKSRK